MTLEARNCSLFDNNQTDSGVQPASYSVKFQELFIQGKVTGGIELYLHSPYSIHGVQTALLSLPNFKTNS
jgi:hypothetical protein